MEIRGVIFDFNGTLFWDSEKHEAAWKSMSARLRGYPFTDQECRERMHGCTNTRILAYALGREPTAEESRQVAAEKEELYRQMCRAERPLRLAPGAEELLDCLARRGVPRAIATSSGPDNIAFYLEEFPLMRYFERRHIIYDDGTMASKPAPDIYLRAAQAIGLAPEHCLICEDAPSGVASARAAGAGRVIGVGPQGARTLRGVLEEHDCISDFRELIPLAEQWSERRK